MKKFASDDQFGLKVRVPIGNLAGGWAGLYSDAGYPDKAGEYYRQALSFLPESQSGKNNLTRFHFNNDRNIDEGMVIVSSILKSSPDNFNYLDTKGWGLYKQGQFQETIDITKKLGSKNDK